MASRGQKEDGSVHRDHWLQSFPAIKSNVNRYLYRAVALFTRSAPVRAFRNRVASKRRGEGEPSPLFIFRFAERNEDISSFRKKRWRKVKGGRRRRRRVNRSSLLSEAASINGTSCLLALVLVRSLLV